MQITRNISFSTRKKLSKDQYMDIYVNYVDDALKIIFKAVIPFKAKLDQNQDRMRYPTLSCQKLTIHCFISNLIK